MNSPVRATALEGQIDGFDRTRGPVLNAGLRFIFKDGCAAGVSAPDHRIAAKICASFPIAFLSVAATIFSCSLPFIFWLRISLGLWP